MKHLLSIEKLPREEVQRILNETVRIKRNRGTGYQKILSGQVWAMLFAKASTRTRVSFEVGIRELGGGACFLPASQITLWRGGLFQGSAPLAGRLWDGALFPAFAP